VLGARQAGRAAGGAAGRGRGGRGWWRRAGQRGARGGHRGRRRGPRGRGAGREAGRAAGPTAGGAAGAAAGRRPPRPEEGGALGVPPRPPRSHAAGRRPPCTSFPLALRPVGRAAACHCEAPRSMVAWRAVRRGTAAGPSVTYGRTVHHAARLQCGSRWAGPRGSTVRCSTNRSLRASRAKNQNENYRRKCQRKGTKDVAGAES